MLSHDFKSTICRAESHTVCNNLKTEHYQKGFQKNRGKLKAMDGCNGFTILWAFVFYCQELPYRGSMWLKIC